LTLSRTDEGTEAFLGKYVFDVDDFEDYLALNGGIRKLNELKRIERLRQPMKAPWRK
jgi:hypothetical protein